MTDEEKMEALKKEFVKNAFKISSVPFKLPIVHIHQDTMPTLDNNKDTFEYAIQFIVQRHQEQINIAMMKNIQTIMKEKGISEYYGIDEKRLLEIVDEAKAFEIIKEKRVDIHNLIYSSNVEEYNKFAMNYNQELCNTLLTQEEYDLLKEVLL